MPAFRVSRARRSASRWHLFCAGTVARSRRSKRPRCLGTVFPARRAGADANQWYRSEVIVWREAGHIIHQASAPASANDFEVARTGLHRIDYQPAGEGGQGTLMQAREREQVHVGHLVGREDAARVDVLPIEQAQDQMICPGCSRSDRGRRLNCVRVARIADDAHYAVFGHGQLAHAAWPTPPNHSCAALCCT
ncbi:hypothetical protein PSAC2689_100013 [Paraburkholderia sacchari]